MAYNMQVKHWLLRLVVPFLSLSMTVVSCNHGQPSPKLLLADSLSVANPDSAYGVLSSMTSFDLRQKRTSHITEC